MIVKSEADAVIAGLNDEIQNLKRALINARHEVAKARGKVCASDSLTTPKTIWKNARSARRLSGMQKN